MMPSQPTIAHSQQTLVRKHPVAAYFVLTFAISWSGALVLAAPILARHESLPKLTGILMFPVMLLGPSITGIVLAGFTAGRAGLAELTRQLTTWRFAPRWYAALLIPPLLILTILSCLVALANPAYAPNRFFMALIFGVQTVLIEDIGRMGYAFSRILSQANAFAPAVLFGLLCSAWQLPVVDFLGSATPHDSLWLSFFLA